MRYFLQFPVIDYRETLVRDITKRIGIYANIDRAPSLYYDYDIPEGQTILDLANDYYGDPYYYWVIMLVNGFTDPYTNWPLSTEILNKQLVLTYGSLEVAEETIVYYRNAQGDKISPQSFEITLSDFKPVSAVQNATEENEKLRSIRLINREYLNQFETEFLALVG